MKSFIIRLKGHELSERIASESVAKANEFNIDVNLFDGVNGLFYKGHLVKLGIRPFKKFKKNRPGVYGCFLSHYYLWKNCAIDDEPYLILEHDGYFIKPLPADILNQFQDVLKLDCVNPYTKDYDKTLEAQKDLKLEIQEVIPTNDQNNGAGWYSPGAYAYIIKPHAARNLVDWVKSNGFLPADQQLASDVCKIETVNTTIVRLHPFYAESTNIKSMSMTMQENMLYDNI